MHYGIEGVAWGTLIPVVVIELLVLVPYAFRTLQVSAWRIAHEAVWPQLLPLLALLAFSLLVSQQTWDHGDWRCLIGITFCGAALLGATIWLRRKLDRSPLATA